MSLSDKAVLINVSFSIPSGTKIDKRVSNKIADDHQVAEGRRAAGNYQKIILDPELFRNIAKIKRNVEGYLNTVSVPYSNEKMPVILPSSALSETTKMLRKAKREFYNELNMIREAYEDKKEDAKKRLSGLYNEKDYRHLDDFMERFSFDSWIRPIPDLDNLDLRFQVSDEEARIIKEEIRVDMIDNLRASVKNVCDRALDTVNHFKKVLDNPKPVIHRSMIEKINALAEALPGLNLTDDEDVDHIASEIKKSLSGLSVSKLRNDVDFRESAVEDADLIIHKLENLYGPPA